MLRLENLYLFGLGLDFDYKIKKLVNESKILSLGELLKLAEEHPELNWDPVYKNINHIQLLLDRKNQKGIEANIYIPKSYSSKKLAVIDKTLYGDDLILQSPTNDEQVAYSSLKHENIETLKKMIQYHDCDAQNALTHIHKVGSKMADKVGPALDMYTAQIERQAKLYTDRSKNLLYKDLDSKECIISDLYSDIILYIIYNSKYKTVWGNLSDCQKRQIVSSTIHNSVLDRLIKDRFIHDISMYTTLPEAESLANGNKKVLSRFIVK